MSNKLSFCVQAATKLKQADLDVVTESIERYVGQGIDERQAETMAVADALAMVADERSEVVDLLAEQHPQLLRDGAREVLRDPTAAQEKAKAAQAEKAAAAAQEEADRQAEQEVQPDPARAEKALHATGLKVLNGGEWQVDSGVLYKDFTVQGEDQEGAKRRAWYGEWDDRGGNSIVVEDESGREQFLPSLKRSPQRTVQVDGERHTIYNSDGQQIVPGHDMARLQNFWRWFEGSKVVDEKGRPLVMYHGTSNDKDFQSFKVGARGAWFTSDQGIASEYAEENDSKGLKYNQDTRRYDEVNSASRVMPVYLRITNPYTLTSEDKFRVNNANYAKGQRELFAEIRSKGYDGILWNNNLNKEWVALGDPNQIKSATGNDGSFDPRSGDITRSAARPTFYSQLELAVESVPDRLQTMSAPQWKLWLDANASKLGVKKDEIEWSGIDDYLKLRGKDKVTRDELAQYVQKNAPRAEAISLYAAGASAESVASDVGVGATTVRRWIAWAGIGRSGAETKGVTDAKRAQALRLYKSGLSVAAVSEQTGLGTSTVHRIVSAAGESRPLGVASGASEETKNDALSLYSLGLNTYEVAELTGVSQTTVASWAADAGISRGYSGAQALRATLGRNINNRGIKATFSSAKSGEMHAASVYELARMHQLEQDPDVVSFSRAGDRIPYADGSKTYVPDLEVVRRDGSVTIEEIKPEPMLEDDDVREKAAAARAFYDVTGKKYRLITERDIGQDGFDLVRPESYPDSGNIKPALATARWAAREAAAATPDDVTPSMREKLKGGAPLFSTKRDVTDTPEFKKWFGDSKVVNEDGSPKVVYHGTPTDFSTFDAGKSFDGGFHFGTSAAAAERLKFWMDGNDGSGRPSIMPVYLSTQNPKRLKNDPVDEESWAEAIEKAKAEGHDGIVYENAIEAPAATALPDDVQEVPSLSYPGGTRLVSKKLGVLADLGNPHANRKKAMDRIGMGVVRVPAESWVAFSPNQIKSAFNDGTFDPSNPDISRSTFRDTALADGYKVSDFLDSSKKVSWWDKTVGSPYHLAQKHPQTFGRVYNAVQQFIADVSKYATRAADMAPNILPKLESMSDIFKSPLSAEDVKALSGPIFQGTLSYHRLDDKPVKTTDVGLAGIVWRDAELRDMWNLNDAQIALYREFRKATNKSIGDMAVTHMIRMAGSDADGVRGRVLAANSVQQASEILADHLGWLAANDPERASVLVNTARAVGEIADQARGLMAKGYAPLSRFGDFTVYVTKNDGKEQVFFGMYETEREANRAARAFREDPQFAGAAVTTGTMSKEAHKLFKGVTPETLALFGQALGLNETANDHQSQMYQEMLKVAKTQRSALKRLIERKGVAGYSEDPGRVLANFIYSNARLSSTNLHAGSILKNVNDIQEGDLKDAGVKLMEYVQTPTPEAQALRGLLFTSYIGGSVSSAVINLTQTFATTWPTLSQHFGIGRSGRELTSALGVLKNGAGDDADLAAAMKRAAEDGITDPNETHALQAQSAGRGSLRSGDGTVTGDTLAKMSNSMSKAMLVWGKLFGLAEVVNRKLAFVAAYRMAREKGMSDPYAFAVKIVNDSQFTQNRGNNPVWARGPIGATLFTFRKYSIFMLENMARMYGNGPEGKRAFALSLAILFLVAGAGGFPFADDLDAIIDSFAQRVLGKSFSSKLEKKQFFAKILGDTGAGFVEGGLSSLPGVPIDVSGRMGMGHLIPGIGLLTKKQDHSKDVADVGGAAGDYIKRLLTAAGSLAQGDFGQAIKSSAPTAVSNALQAADMLETGTYRDAKGRKITDTTPTEAILKGIGFQPHSVHDIQEAAGIVQDLVGQNRLRSQEIADLWAKGKIEKNPELVAEAQRQLKEWNDANPESRLNVAPSAINKRVQQANMDKAKRLTLTAPKGIRATVKETLAPALSE